MTGGTRTLPHGKTRRPGTAPMTRNHAAAIVATPLEQPYRGQAPDGAPCPRRPPDDAADKTRKRPEHHVDAEIFFAVPLDSQSHLA